MNDAQAIAVRPSSDLAALTELEAILLGAQEVPELVEDPAQIQREILAQLLSAESDAELEAMNQAQGWGELEGVPMLLHSFKWRPSEFEEGPPVYFIVFGTRLDTGEPVTLTIGSVNVLAQLTNMAKRETLNGAVRKLETASKQTKSGYYPKMLRAPMQTELEALRARGGVIDQPPAQEAEAS
jgi:hypothetical protein